MKIVALLTGKGGSSLKNKNIFKIYKKKILDYPCLAAKNVNEIDEFFVSSENNLILKAASKRGFKPILRPKKYSKNNSKHIDVLIHSLKFFKKKNIYPDILVVLLANSPTIKSSWIKKSISILKKNRKISSVVPVQANNDFHPLRAKRVVGNRLRPYLKNNKNISTNRQDLENNYFLCHNFWTIRTKEILKNNGYLPWKFMGKNCYPLIINNSVDIHDQKDLLLARFLINKHFR